MSNRNKTKIFYERMLFIDITVSMQKLTLTTENFYLIYARLFMGRTNMLVFGGSSNVISVMLCYVIGPSITRFNDVARYILRICIILCK